MAADMILVAGEALVDLIPLSGSSYEAVLGGSPFNTAIGLGRLGAPTGYAGRVSTDAMGEAIVERLNASGVGLGFVARAPEPSPLAFVTKGTEATGARYAFYLGSTAYDGLSPLPDAWPDHVGHLHVGSFSATDGALGARAYEALVKADGKATTSYDPNIRPHVVGPRDDTLALVEARVRAATVVKASDEDMLWLHPNHEPDAVAAAWATAGPRLVVLTRGGAGAAAFFDGRTVDCPSPHITVVDTVGAGDSFMAALLTAMNEDGALGRASRIDPEPYTDAQVAGWLGFAVAAAAVTCTRKGADPPTRDEMRYVMASAKPPAA